MHTKTRLEGRAHRTCSSWATLWGLLSLLACSVTARAHHVQPSALVLSLRPGAVDATLKLPVDQLGLALAKTFGEPSLVDLAIHPERVDDDFAERLRAYVADYLTIRDDRDREYAEAVGRPRWVAGDDGPELHFAVTLTAPDDYAPKLLRVHSEVVSEEVVSHRTLLSVAGDFERGELGADERMLGTLRFGRRELTIDRSDTSPWLGMLSMVELGVRHIAEGFDHLLFVLVLLLPAPLLAARAAGSRRWGPRRTLRQALGHLAGLVTAFTLGHSATLAAGVSGVALLPSKLVEVLVGLSIAVGAVHAMRPLFPGREALIAGAFGLVHGLAFASTLEGFRLCGGALALALGSFNLGIELVQLALVVSVAPLLLAAARRQSYHFLRLGLAGFALMASVGFVAEQWTGQRNAITHLLERAARAPLESFAWLMGSLTLWAAASLWLSRDRLVHAR